MYDLPDLLASFVLRTQIKVYNITFTNKLIRGVEEEAISFDLFNSINRRVENITFFKETNTLASITYPLSNILLSKYIDYSDPDAFTTDTYNWDVEYYIYRIFIPEIIEYSLLRELTEHNYCLTVKIDGKKWNKEYRLRNVDLLYQILSAVKSIRNGYKIEEVTGSHNIITRGRYVAISTSQDCNCKQFNLANRREIPCQHIMLTRVYKDNRKLFIDNGQGLYKII